MISMNTAKLNSILIALLLILACSSLAASGDPVSSCSALTNGLQFCISLTNSHYSALEPIIVNLVVSNSSDKVLMIAAGRPEWLCEVRVIHESIGEVAWTRYGQNASEGSWHSHLKPLGIEAGECRRDPLLLNRYYDMSLAGIYRVSVRRRLSMPGSGKATVGESGEVEISVTAEVPGARSAWGGE